MVKLRFSIADSAYGDGEAEALLLRMARRGKFRDRRNLANRPSVLVYPALSSTLSKDQDDLGSSGLKSLRALALLGSGSVWRLGFATVSSADEVEHGLVVADYTWPHSVLLSSYDHADLCFQNVYYQMLIFAYSCIKGGGQSVKEIRDTTLVARFLMLDTADRLGARGASEVGFSFNSMIFGEVALQRKNKFGCCSLLQ